MTRAALIAFSGGLDTSFLVSYAREELGYNKIVTCTVNTGGFSKEEREQIEERARELGADDHVTIEAEERYYQSILKYMIFGNVTRDGYPLSVGAERLIQGMCAIEQCKKRGISTFIHGSTGAGNDQYRFDLVAYVLGGKDIQCVTPIREQNFSREFTTSYLVDRGVSVPERRTRYSYNVGLWGVSIGGTETHSSTGLVPEDAWHSHSDEHASEEVVELEFAKGEVVSAQSNIGSADSPVACIQLLAQTGNRYSIGRGYHTGTSIPGKKGRLAYEAPAAALLYAAHQTLEKITLTQEQIHGKKNIANEFGRLVHEAKFFDPYLDDLKAFLQASQSRVTGTATLYISQRGIDAVTADSPYNLMNAGGSVYGETAEFYSGADARGASRLNAYEQMIYHSFND